MRAYIALLLCIAIASAACAAPCQLIVLNDPAYPDDRPEDGEMLVLLTDEEVLAEEFVSGRPRAPSCILRKKGAVVVVTHDDWNYLLRYLSPGEPQPGECPHGSTFVDDMRVYGFLAHNAQGLKIYVHESAAYSAMRSRGRFRNAKTAP